MHKAANPIPRKYRGAIPYLNVRNGAGALAFYRDAFGCSELARILRDDGKLAHAELAIGDALFMVRDEIPAMKFLSPESVGGTPVEILVYVPDADSFVARAAAAGAHVVKAVEEQFHGDRMGVLEDLFGHVWFFATRTEELSPRELSERALKWGI